MPDSFDPYREALVMETNTVWPDKYRELDAVKRSHIEEALHADPQSCQQIDYVRVHTGFCRQITVTADDLARIGQTGS